VPAEFLQVFLGGVETVDLDDPGLVAEDYLLLAVGDHDVGYRVLCAGSLAVGQKRLERL